MPSANLAGFGVPEFEDSVTQLLNDSSSHLFNNSVIQLFEEDEPNKKKTDKWLFAAVFGINDGFSDGNSNKYSQSSSVGVSPKMELSGNNDYAAYMSGNIRSFNNMSLDDFTNISHRPPLSFGITARKSLGKRAGLESGFVYTYLASRYEWSGYDVQQGLHYVGVPANMVVYLWNSKPNWQIYLSGGFMVEKGLRGIYKQERWHESEHRTTTVKSSSINGWQWSLNGALGINYRLEKGWGVYFEPRVGYSFDCNQPVSIRTEMPVFVGVSMGLNYQL